MNEINEILNDLNIEAGVLVPATRNIYQNTNLTDHENVFIKHTRPHNANIWFDREVKEATIAHQLLTGEVETIAPLLNNAIVLSDGSHITVWPYVPISIVHDTAREKINKLLLTAKALEIATPPRLNFTELPLCDEGWSYTADRALSRISNYSNLHDLHKGIESSINYIASQDKKLGWIHGDLHSANLIDGTNYVIDWEGTHLGFVEWDLAHIVKEPFHYIDHDHWPQGENDLRWTLSKIIELFPGANIELIRQCVILRRSSAILWKQESGFTGLGRWERTLDWFKSVSLEEYI